jgi:hypothetical protein
MSKFEDPTPVWFVGVCASAAMLVGSAAAVVVATALTPGGVAGDMGFGYPRGLTVFDVALLFGLPISGLVTAATAYGVVLAHRSARLGVLLVGAGAITGVLIGWGTPTIATWWVNLVVSDGLGGWAEITALLTAALVATILLSGRVALELAPVSRKARLVFLLGMGAILGLCIGLLIGGQVGILSSFQGSCGPEFGSGSGPVECIGSGPGPGFAAGMLLGAWEGGLVGIGLGTLIWAVPPLARRDMGTD